MKMNHSLGRGRSGGGGRRRARLRMPAKEFRVVFVRQWVEWKGSELERLEALGRLIRQQCVGWG